VVHVDVERGGEAVFGADYLSGATRFEASELWTVLTVNGWLSRLDQGAYAQPRIARGGSDAAAA
jgi:predicted transcriptional regulator of viral defense system